MNVDEIHHAYLDYRADLAKLVTSSLVPNFLHPHELATVHKETFIYELKC